MNGLIGGSIGVILVGWSVFSGGQSVVFAALGQTAAGVVTHSESSGHQSRAYTDYSFQAGGHTYAGTASGLELTEGRAVTVVFLPSHPDTNRLDRQHWLPMGLLALLVGGVAIAFAVKCFRSTDDLIE